MVSGAGLVAALFVLLGHGMLVVICARLASHGRAVEGRGGEALPWALPVVSAALMGVAGLDLAARYASGTLGARPEAVAILGMQALAGFLLVVFLRKRHEHLHGERPEGTGRTGTLLLVTSVAGTLAIASAGFGRWAHLLVALGLGAWAWAYLEASVSARRSPAPPWAGALAMGAAQILVAGALARVLLANAAAQDFSVFVYSRVLTATVTALAVGLAWPALAGLAAERREKDAPKKVAVATEARQG